MIIDCIIGSFGKYISFDDLYDLEALLEMIKFRGSLNSMFYYTRDEILSVCNYYAKDKMEAIISDKNETDGGVYENLGLVFVWIRFPFKICCFSNSEFGTKQACNCVLFETVSYKLST